MNWNGRENANGHNGCVTSYDCVYEEISYDSAVFQHVEVFADEGSANNAYNDINENNLFARDLSIEKAANKWYVTYLF